MPSRRPETESAIKTAAFNLFAEKSYHNVSIDEVARKVGVSKGAIFHYFSSKYQLAVESLIGSMSDLYDEHFFEKIESLSPNEQLRKVIENIVFKFLEFPKVIRFMLEITELAPKDKENTETFKTLLKWQEENIKVITKILEKSGSNNVDIRTQLLISCLDGLVYSYGISKELGQEFDMNAYINELVDLFMPEKDRYR